jgi:phenylacetate-CoA ligase
MQEALVKTVAQYWNPVLETLPREKLQQFQLEKFKQILKWAYENSPFYRRLYKEAGLEPGDIETFDDISKVPKTEKSMLREAQGVEPYPYGTILSVPLEQVTEYRQTSGTTGQPVYHLGLRPLCSRLPRLRPGVFALRLQR